MDHRDEMRRLIKLVEAANRDDDNAVTSDKQRHDIVEKMGYLRHEIVDLTSKVVHPKSTPEELKRGLAGLSQSMQSALLPYNMRPGLWAKHPTRELRLINDPTLNMLIRNLPYFYEAIDNKNLDLVKKGLVAAENSLLQTTNSIYADLGLPEVQSFFQQ